MKRFLITLLVLLFASTAQAGFFSGGGSSSVDAASTSAAGKVELATDAETVTGSATDRVTTPANITARLAAPGAIGETTPGAGSFSGVTVTGLTASKPVFTDGSKGLSSSGTMPVAQGGTGLTALGTAGQVLRVNSGASALEYGTVSSTVPIGHLSGLTVSRKDNDEIYVSGGSVEIEGVLYNSDAQLTGSGGSLADTYGGTNLVVASSVSGGDYGTYTAENLSDDNPATPTPQDYIYDNPLVIDFGGDRAVGKIRFYVVTSSATAKVEYSTNGSDYTQIFSGAVSKDEWKELTGDWTARYIRISRASFENLYVSAVKIYALIGGYTAHYVYVDPPASGTELAAGNLIISSTVPSFDSAKGGYYHTTNTDQRAIAQFTTDASGYVPTSPFVHYQPVPQVSSGAQLLSITNLPLNADGETTIYTVPAGVRCVLSYAILVAGADAGSTDLTIGADGAETDWLGTQQLDNLDAENDAVMLMPVPNATPVKIKSYAAGTVIKAVVANNAGGATNTLYLYGMLY